LVGGTDYQLGESNLAGSNYTVPRLKTPQHFYPAPRHDP
jgi:hypothetical protein